MTQTFEQYLQQAKDKFIIAVFDLHLSPKERVQMENFIIAFDQCRDRLNRPTREEAENECESSNYALYKEGFMEGFDFAKKTKEK